MDIDLDREDGDQSDQRSLFEETNQYGQWSQAYKTLSMVGLLMMIVGGLMLMGVMVADLNSENLSVVAMILLAIGAFIAIPCAFGYREEKKKKGVKKVKTNEGRLSLIVLIIGIVLGWVSYYIFFAAAIIAVITGFIGMRKGDNYYAKIGFWMGIIIFGFAGVLLLLVSIY
ncbi:MAG: hypothetical protein ACLFVL_01830 [Candidatus Aenigmatarchaeota archaeon]